MRDELYLRRIKPRWKNVAELVRDLGCEVMLYGDYEELHESITRGTPIGNAPGDAHLLRGGHIVAPIGVSEDDLLHEALHWRLGPQSMDGVFSESALMVIQLSLIRRIASDEERRALLRDFEVYLLDGIDVHGIIKRDGKDWVRSKEWGDLLDETAEQGYLPDGRLPPQKPLPASWM